MASSTLFRGRRIVDPVPVQRGPSPRDGKYQSSFSGSTFEWCSDKTRRFILLLASLTCISDQSSRFVLIIVICLCLYLR